MARRVASRGVGRKAESVVRGSMVEEEVEAAVDGESGTVPLTIIGLRLVAMSVGLA